MIPRGSPLPLKWGLWNTRPHFNRPFFWRNREGTSFLCNGGSHAEAREHKNEPCQGRALI